MFMVTIEGCFIVPEFCWLFSGWQDSFSLSRSVRALLICVLIIMDSFLGLLCSAILLLKCILSRALVTKTVFHLCIKQSSRLQ